MALLIREVDVNSTLTYPMAYSAMREAFEFLDRKMAVNSKRMRTSISGSTLTYQAGGFREYLGYKTFVNGTFMSTLFDKNGEILSMIESDRLTQIRTGALSVLASDFTVKAYSSVGIIGLGKQGLAQIEAFHELKPGVKIDVFTRSQDRMKNALSYLQSKGIKVFPVDMKTLCKESEVVVTITRAKDPFLKLDYLNKGTHVNAMGSNIPEKSELYPEVVKSSSMIVVEDVDMALEEAGDLILSKKMGMLDENKIVTISSMISGRAKARREEGLVTLFKSVGIGLEDVAVMSSLYEEVKRKGNALELEVKGKWRRE
ncbi:ornithine cyclodeaminase family protein [Sulfuracidifex tepidarius]|uniref:ornithine cyclodeaminase family protein n=1 Tax=Sulfuracidifex tepidarius TaxID=1294262 RepID=UPI0011F3B263|nr:ornithine cyclodeaminase family protein [Sulfuracidifex tepidarius]